MDKEKKVVSANVFQLIYLKGNVRALLSASDSGAKFVISNASGKAQIKISAADDGTSSLNLFDSSGSEKIEISLDDKGTHVHLTGEGKQETYLFLKNSGASGLVLTDQAGNRRLAAKIGPDSQPNVTIYPLTGGPKHL